MTNIDKIRLMMKDNGVDMYLILDADYHKSEYVSDYFKARSFISGFTGSNGSLLVTLDSCYLWTDGRYFIQAEQELANTDIKLMRIGVKGVLSLLDFIAANKGVLGLDGRCMDAAFVNSLKRKKIEVKDLNLIDEIFTDRPSHCNEMAFELDIHFSGESRESKIERLIANSPNSIQIIEHLDAVNYLMNIRAHDINHFPVLFSYLVVSKDFRWYFADEKKLPHDLKGKLLAEGFEIRPYENYYQDIASIRDQTIVMDFNKISFKSYQEVYLHNVLFNKASYADMMKACKNEQEIKNLRAAHIVDGVAMVKFIYKLKKEYANYDEYTAGRMLDEIRLESALELSFNTIAGYKENAAMMHYSAKKESAKKLDKDGMLLVDSGGHYLLGTTDITRTISFDKVSKRERKLYTTVLKANLNLASAKFLKGISGVNLDILARNPIWQLGIDYRSGTGHGVGYLLSVHEGPHGIRYQKSNLRNEDTKLVEGMVVTDEPGIYLENELGIRLENELVVYKEFENEYGEFMNFDVITYCPFDRALINKKLLTKAELKQVNDYHKMVYKKLKNHLDEDERKWLKQECAKL